jgi:hypothetical protein
MKIANRHSHFFLRAIRDIASAEVGASRTEGELI